MKTYEWKCIEAKTGVNRLMNNGLQFMSVPSRVMFDPINTFICLDISDHISIYDDLKYGWFFLFKKKQVSWVGQQWTESQVPHRG
jgi:hypothetical protein